MCGVGSGWGGWVRVRWGRGVRGGAPVIAWLQVFYHGVAYGAYVRCAGGLAVRAWSTHSQMEATLPAPRVDPVLVALERAVPSSVLKKTGTLGKLFETKTPSVTVLTDGRSRSPSPNRRVHDPRKGRAKKSGTVLSRQMTFMDEHGRSVRGRQNLKMQADQRKWTAEDFVANQAELPKHLRVGTRVEHEGRGWGTIVNLQSWYPPMVSVEFDQGEIHTYKATPHFQP